MLLFVGIMFIMILFGGVNPKFYAVVISFWMLQINNWNLMLVVGF